MIIVILNPGSIMIKVASAHKRFAILLGLLFILQWALLFWDFYPTWDGTFYYSYARSIVFDGDLNLENDLQLSYPSATADFVLKRYDEIRTETGRVNSPFPLGSALIWLPWLAILRFASFIGQGLGWLPGQLSGYEWYFALNIAMLSALLGLIAFWTGYIISAKETNRWSAAAACITLLFTTPLLYYQYREPLYTHATSAFIVGAVIYSWWRSLGKQESKANGLLLGALIGLAGLVRWQHLVYLILPVTTAIWTVFSTPPEQRRQEGLKAFRYLALVVFAALVVFTPQIAHWQVMYGNLVTIPQGTSYIDWRAPFLGPFMFSSFRGVLPWLPIAALAVVGLVIMAKKRPQLAIPLLLALALEAYVGASTRDWFGGGGFGPRRLTSELVILIIGYAGLIMALPERLRRPLAIIAGIVLTIHQWILLRFGLEEKIGGRVQSMYPDYHWAEESLGEFSQRILDHVPDLWRNPQDFWALNRSPIDLLLSNSWPWLQLFALIATTLFMIILIFVWMSGWKRIGSRFNDYRWWVALGLFLILAADVWLLFRA